MLWDRRKRIDKIFGSGGDKPRKQNPSKKSKRRIRKQYEDSDEEEEEEDKTKSFKGDENELENDEIVSASSWPDGFKILPNQCFTFSSTENAWKQSKTRLLSKNDAISTARDEYSLKIVSFNVLFGLFGLDVGTREDDRIPALLNCICNEDADIICLQEVTDKLLSVLLETPWIRCRYYITQIDGMSHRLLIPCGQVILCKFPLSQTAIYNFGLNKRLLAVEIRLNKTFALKLVNVHLTSAKREDDPTKVEMGFKRRVQQLATAMEVADDANPTLVVGDFNFGDNSQEYVELKKLMEIQEYRDPWLELNSDNPGYTYAPDTNELAAYTVTKHFEPRRLDRILVRTGDRFSVAFDTMKLLGLEPVAIGHKPVFMSDHYGLSLLLQIKNNKIDFENNGFATQPKVDVAPAKSSDVFSPRSVDYFASANAAEVSYVCSTEHSTLRPVHTSALCLLPSKLGPFYPLVQHIRAQFDPHCHRWPPHINILYPFIPDENHNFQTALTAMNTILNDWEYFGTHLKLTFASFGIFERKNSSTVFLYPEFCRNLPYDESEERKVLLFLNNRQSKVMDRSFRISDQNEQRFVEHPLNLLYQTLKKSFRSCGDDRHNNMMPHLSVATFGDPSEARLAAKTWQATWKPITCEFSSLALLSRTKDSPFSMKHRFYWCESEQESETVFSKETIRYLREVGRQCLIDILAKADVDVDALWFGSVAVDLDSISSDADLCICSTKSVEEVIRILSAKDQLPLDLLDDNKFSRGFYLPTFCLWHCVNYSEESSFKLLRYEEAISKSIQIEVAFAQVPQSWFTSKSHLNFNQMKDELSSCLDWVSLKSLSGIRDCEYLKDLLNNSSPILRKFLVIIKRWAQLKRVDSHCMGFVPSIAWLALAIDVYQLYGNDLSQLEEIEVINQLVFRFFHQFSTKVKWTPSDGCAVAVTEESKDIARNFYKSTNTKTKGSQHMCVMGFTYPCSNYCRNIASSTMAVIREEMKMALLDFQLNENLEDILYPLDIKFFKLYNFYLSISLKLTDVPMSSDSNILSKWPVEFPPNLHNINFQHKQLRISYKWFLSQIVNIVFELEKCLKQPKHKQVVAHPFTELFSFSHQTLTTFVGYNIESLEEMKVGRYEKIIEQFKLEFEKWKINPSVNCDNVRLEFQMMEKSNEDIKSLATMDYYLSHKILT